MYMLVECKRKNTVNIVVKVTVLAHAVLIKQTPVSYNKHTP